MENKPIDYLQELKKDVSTEGLLTPLQKRCFEKLEETLNQPVKDLKKLYDEISYRLMPNPARDLKMYEFLREVKQLIEIHYQPDPIIEEVKQEWEDDGYTWEEDKDFITICKEDPLDEEIVKEILIYKYSKTYECYNAADYESTSLSLTLQEHIRLTKTFKALKLEV